MRDTAEEVIDRELDDDEELLWAGQPRQGLVLRASDSLMIPFSILWGGFAIVWEALAVGMGAPWFFMLWGVPFVLVGLYMMVGRFFVDAYQRARTFYGVGSGQVIIVSGVFSRRVKSLDVAQLSDISFTERRNGSGTILFGSMPPFFRMMTGGGWPGTSHYLMPSFELIDEVREVYNLIREAQRAARQGNITTGMHDE